MLGKRIKNGSIKQYNLQRAMQEVWHRRKYGRHIWKLTSKIFVKPRKWHGDYNL